ncbi:MAG TPA: chorismate synthase [Firmicutes bacterium]|nr:chorismate synthase [Bacillota bacterium]
MVAAWRLSTAGESHGKALVAVVAGPPAGLSLTAADIDRDLSRRQQGYGRGGRMAIERDRCEILAGVRHGRTLGSPVALLVPNRDWPNWTEIMSPGPVAEVSALTGRGAPSRRPRPGHADLAGALKYGHGDLRNVLERASARSTAAVVAAGAVARRFLAEFGVACGSCVTAIGGVKASAGPVTPERLALADDSPLRCLDPAAEAEMKRRIDQARVAGDTLGGVFEVWVFGLPPGLGTYVTPEGRLDGRLAGAVMAIPAIKGVEFGDGFALAATPGSRAHDPILPGLRRASNHAGGLEGGMTNGEPLVLRAAMKPIATLGQPLPTVDLDTGEAVPADFHRSDVCAVPAAAVVAEAQVLLVLADAFAAKFGGDSLPEVRRAYDSYREEVQRWAKPTSS